MYKRQLPLIHHHPHAHLVRHVKATFASVCRACEQPINVGQVIAKCFTRQCFVHAKCVYATPRRQASQRFQHYHPAPQYIYWNTPRTEPTSTHVHPMQLTTPPQPNPPFVFRSSESVTYINPPSSHKQFRASTHQHHQTPSTTPLQSQDIDPDATLIPEHTTRLQDTVQQHTAFPTPTLHLHPHHRRPTSYVNEVTKYIQFFQGRGAIPGVHRPFDHPSIEEYLFFRGRKTKKLWGITSKLKWMGTIYGYVLPNHQHQQPSLLYQRIKDSIRRITLWIKVTRGLTVIQALGLDNMAVAVIMSHYRCFNRRSLMQLPWRCIVYLTQSILAHSACLRHGHFSAHNIMRDNLTRPPLTHGWRLESHWGKYEDLTEVFFYDMPAAKPGWYHLMCERRSPPVTITAAMFLSWYISIRDCKFPDSPLLFPGLPSISQRKSDYTMWLKRTITAAVPQFPQKFLRSIRPHGWRAGWVCDRRKDGTPDNVTMREGRWSSERAMGPRVV